MVLYYSCDKLEYDRVTGLAIRTTVPEIFFTLAINRANAVEFLRKFVGCVEQTIIDRTP